MSISSASVFHISNLPPKQIEVQITDFLEVKAEVNFNQRGPWYGLADTVYFRSKNLYIPPYGSGPVRNSEKQLQAKAKRQASSPNLKSHQKELIDTRAGPKFDHQVSPDINFNPDFSALDLTFPQGSSEDFKSCESSGESASGSTKSKSKASKIKRMISKPRREAWE